MADEIPYTPVTPDSTESTPLPGVPIVVPGASFYAASNTIDTVSAPASLGIVVGMGVSGQFITPGTVVTEILDPGVGLGVGISLPTEDESFGTDITFSPPVAATGGIAPEADGDNPATSPIAPSPVTPPATAAIAPATDGDNPATSAIAPSPVTPPATGTIAPAADGDDAETDEIPAGGDGEAPSPAAPQSSPAVRYDIAQDLTEEQQQQAAANLALDREATPNFRGLLLGPTEDNAVAIQGEQAGVVDAEVVGPAAATILTLDATGLTPGMYAHDAFPPGTTIVSIGGTAPSNTVEFNAGKLASGTDTVRFSVNPSPFPRIALNVGSYTVFLVDHQGNGNFAGNLNVAGSAEITGLLTVDGGINVTGSVDCGTLYTGTLYTNAIRLSGPGGLQLYDSNGDPIATIADDGELVCPSIDTGAIVANAAFIGGYQLIIGANLTFGTTGRALAATATSSAARTALGLIIGTDVQAQSTNLSTLAAITPGATGQALLGAATVTAARLALRIGPSTTIPIGDSAWTGLTLTGTALVAAYSAARRVAVINSSTAGLHRFVFDTQGLSNPIAGPTNQVNFSQSFRATIRARVQVGTLTTSLISFHVGCSSTPAAHDPAQKTHVIQISGDGSSGRRVRVITHNGTSPSASSWVTWTPATTDTTDMELLWLTGTSLSLSVNGTQVCTLTTSLPTGLGTASSTSLAVLAENVSSSTQTYYDLTSWELARIF